MTRTLILTRDEGEALVDILDACPDAPYARELNREIRRLFGMLPMQPDSSHPPPPALSAPDLPLS